MELSCKGSSFFAEAFFHVFGMRSCMEPRYWSSQGKAFFFFSWSLLLLLSCSCIPCVGAESIREPKALRVSLLVKSHKREERRKGRKVVKMPKQGTVSLCPINLDKSHAQHKCIANPSNVQVLEHHEWVTPTWPRVDRRTSRFEKPFGSKWWPTAKKGGVRLCEMYPCGGRDKFFLAKGDKLLAMKAESFAFEREREGSFTPLQGTISRWGKYGWTILDPQCGWHGPCDPIWR